MSEYKEEPDEQIFTTDSWRVFRIIAEFVDGFETLQKLGPSVSIFGSAREREGSPYYNLAVELGIKLGEKGFSVITGGGPGIMEGANRGAQVAKGKSCGVGIDVPAEEGANNYVDPDYRLKFRYFFVRKVMFIRYAQACVFFPGGYGTLDELFEVLTLIQTDKIHPFPIYLIGSSYWKGLKEWIEQNTLAKNYISKEDVQLMIISDDPDEVARGIEDNFRKRQNLKNF